MYQNVKHSHLQRNLVWENNSRNITTIEIIFSYIYHYYFYYDIRCYCVYIACNLTVCNYIITNFNSFIYSNLQTDDS